MDDNNSSHIQSLGVGRSVDNGDQLSSVVILGIGAVGALVALVLTALL